VTIVVSSLAQRQRWRHRINVESMLIMFVTLFRCWANVSLPDGISSGDLSHLFYQVITYFLSRCDLSTYFYMNTVLQTVCTVNGSAVLIRLRLHKVTNHLLYLQLVLRVFSSGKMFMRPHRARLTDSVFVKCNMNNEHAVCHILACPCSTATKLYDN